MSNTVQKLCPRHLLLIGVTLFSMFFGSGNLIFPSYIGYQAGTSAPFAFAGFALSAVVLPVLGVAAVARCGGLDRLCERVHPRFSQVFSIIIYLCIGPMLAIPRTASTSYSMFTFLTDRLHGSFLGIPVPMLAQVLFSLLFFTAATAAANRPERLKDLLGRHMTPVLLVLILILFAAGLLHPSLPAAAAADGWNRQPFLKGFTEGYQTMDTMAAVVFGIIIAINIRALGVEENSSVVRETMRGGVIAGLFLCGVYGMLTFLGARSGSLVQGAQNGTEILTALCREFFGGTGAVLLALIFFIACFNVCVGLICSCSRFFAEQFPALSFRQWKLGITAWSFVVSILGLNLILAISSPILSVIYPVAIAIILVNLLPFSVLKKSWLQRAIVLLALASGIASIW